MGVFMGNKHSWGSKIVTFENFLGREVSHPHWKILKLPLLDAAHLLHRSRMISRFHPSKSSSEARWHFSLKFCAACHTDKETGDPVCPKWNVHLKKCCKAYMKPVWHLLFSEFDKLNKYQHESIMQRFVLPFRIGFCHMRFKISMFLTNVCKNAANLSGTHSLSVGCNCSGNNIVGNFRFLSLELCSTQCWFKFKRFPPQKLTITAWKKKKYGVTNYEILHEWRIWGIGKQWLKQMKEIRK